MHQINIKKLNDIRVKRLLASKTLEQLKKEFPNDESLRKILYTQNPNKWYNVIGNLRYHRDYGEATRDQIEQNAFELYIAGIDINTLAPVLKKRNPDQFGGMKYKYEDVNQNKIAKKCISKVFKNLAQFLKDENKKR